MHFFRGCEQWAKVATAGNSILPGGWRHPAILASRHTGILASWRPGAAEVTQVTLLWICGQHWRLLLERKEVRTCRPGKKLRQQNIHNEVVKIAQFLFLSLPY